MKKPTGWLLFSDPPNGRREGKSQPEGSNRVGHRKNEGLEEETLVTSSNPISQVLW